MRNLNEMLSTYGWSEKNGTVSNSLNKEVVYISYEKKGVMYLNNMGDTKLMQCSDNTLISALETLLIQYYFCKPINS